MKDIGISEDSLEDLLTYDDLFLDYFNAFLGLPAFPQPLQYDRLSGVFGEVTELHGDEQSELSTHDDKKQAYGVTDAKRESMLLWAREERLPLFVRTPLFRELKLLKLLLRRLDDRRSGSSRRAPRDGSSSHIRGYSRQTGTYASSLSNSGDNSGAADNTGYGEEIDDEEYDRWNEDDGDRDAGSRPSSLPPHLGLESLASSESAAVEARRIAAAAHRKRVAKQAEEMADDEDYYAPVGEYNHSSDTKSRGADLENKRSYSAPVNYREFLRMPMYADFDDIFMNEETDYDGRPYVAYAEPGESGPASEEQTDTDVRALESETNLTFQQIKEKTLATRTLMEHFRKFLRDTSALQLLNFWLDCENYKDRMEQYDDVQNMAVRNRLFRDIQDKYKLSLTEEAKVQIARAASSYQLSHAVFIRTQYDVLRRLRTYWVPRYILHREKENSLLGLLSDKKAVDELPEGGEKYCASFLPAVSVVGSLPIRHDDILALTRTSTWPQLSRAGVQAFSERVRSGRHYSRDGAAVSAMRVRDMMLVAFAADNIAGGPFAAYLASKHKSSPHLLAGLLFWEDVTEYGRAEDRSADRLLRMNRAWAIFNSYLAEGCQHRVDLKYAACTQIHSALMASSNYVEAALFDDAKTSVIQSLEPSWVHFLREDTKRFWECVQPPGSKGTDLSLDAIEIVIVKDYPRIIVRRPTTVKLPRLGSNDHEDNRDGGRQTLPLLYMSESERAERRRIAVERRRELQREQRRVLREFRKRKEAEKQRVLIERALEFDQDLNARKAAQPNAEADDKRNKGEGHYDDRDDDDTYYSRRSGARASTVREGSRGISTGFSKELQHVEKEISFRDFGGNRPIMSMFKKYLHEHDVKDQVNMVSLHSEIEGYFELDAKPHTKRDMQSTFVYKTYMDKASKKAVPLPDRYRSRHAGSERDCPRTPTLLDVQRYVASELDPMFRRFFEHQADSFGVDPQTLASMSHAELALRSETDASLAKAFTKKGGGGKNKKTGKAPPSKEDKATLLAELSRCQSSGGGRPTLLMLHFWKYLAKHGSDEDGALIERDLAFYLEVQKFKELSHAHCDDELVRRKAQAIVDCFLECPINPPCQIDAPPDVCARVTKAVLKYAQGKDVATAPGQGHSPASLFDDAHVAVFKELLPYWAGFVKQFKPPENPDEIPQTKHQKELRRRYEEFINAKTPIEQKISLPAIAAIVSKTSAISFSLIEGLKPAKGYDVDDSDHFHHPVRPDSDGSNNHLAVVKGAGVGHHGSRKSLILHGIKEQEA